MAKAITQKKVINSLIQLIKQEIYSGKQRIEKTIENEKTVTYWNIGKHIYEHILEYSDRAKYNEYLFGIISEELTISMSTLYRAVKFYETYQNILAPGDCCVTIYKIL